MILEVALPVPVFKTFDYKVSDEIQGFDESLLLGRRVRVPFGFKSAVGIICGIKPSSEAPDSILKTVAQLLDEEPLLDEKQVALGRWLSEHYLSSLGEALFALLPPGTGSQRDTFQLAEPFLPVGGDERCPFENRYRLTEEQKVAVARLHEAVFGAKEAGKSFLLLGVAAAGKTEVYLSAIKDVLSQDKNVLYLAPEIGLAIQSYDVLRSRFGDDHVLLWHSDIPLKTRRQDWWRIKRGEISVVVGSRSATLLPQPNIGLIIVDEEQDTAFKEDHKPRFHSREVARFRAAQHDAVLIYGSATPSLELIHAAETKEIQLLEIQSRAVPSSAPQVRIVDLTKEKPRGFLSPALLEALRARLEAHQQSILFLNRRGFYRYLRCPTCGWVARCEKCGVALVEHGHRSSSPPRQGRGQGRGAPLLASPATQHGGGGTGTLSCHYCTQSVPPPPACPECGHKKLFAGGYGTERVEEELKEQFPWIRVVRWDRDAAGKRGGHQKLFDALKEGKFDVLVGTQVVAQGFNFPGVTLVGVVDADVPLYVPDFRAAEHAFQILTQVAGRAGREMVTGEVIIQTRHPDHHALRAAAQMDYQLFSTEELRFRESLNYPPFSTLVRIKTQMKGPDKAEAEMEE